MGPAGQRTGTCLSVCERTGAGRAVKENKWLSTGPWPWDVSFRWWRRARGGQEYKGPTEQPVARTTRESSLRENPEFKEESHLSRARPQGVFGDPHIADQPPFV